jgi:hypothetical protein
MRLRVISALALAALQAASCGGSATKVESKVTASGASASMRRVEARTMLLGSPSKRYLDDGDNDPRNDNDFDNLNGKTVDDDKDAYEDFIEPGNDRYHDLDDREAVGFGRRANPAVARAVRFAVKRFYAAAVAGDAAKACSALVPDFARSVARDYGRGSVGPAYLRSGTTCEGVMALLFGHMHAELTAALDVTGVRVDGHTARALIGSSAMPAEYIDLQDVTGVWRIDALLGSPLS